MNKAWIDPDQKYKAPNLVKLQGRFQDISYWVQYSILSVDNVRVRRSKMIEKFIRIAEVFIYINQPQIFFQNLKANKNYQTLFPVLSGLSSASIVRLSSAFAELPLKLKEMLNTDLLPIISKDNNYRNYRDIFRYAVVPCVPYIDALLNDILATEDQNPDFINGLINFQKRQLLFQHITKLQSYQQRPYNFQAISQIAAFLQRSVPNISEAELMQLSLKCETKK